MKEAILLLVGGIVSFVFRFLPFLSVKFDALESKVKQAIMAGVLLLVMASVFGLNCVSGVSMPANLVMACDQQSALSLASMYILLVVGNQSTYSLIKK